MNKTAKVLDKATGLSGEVVDVGTGAGALVVYVKLENGETVGRSLSEIQYVDEGGEKK